MEWLFEKSSKVVYFDDKTKVNNRHFSNAFRFFCICLSLAGWVFILSSCSGWGRIPSASNVDPVVLDTSINNVKNEKDKINDASVQIGVSADKIDEHTDNIQAKSPKEVLPTFLEDITGIRNETDDLRNAKSKLDATTMQLGNVQQELERQKENAAANSDRTNKIIKDKERIEKELAKAKEENAQLFRKLIAWLGVTCTIGIGVSVALAFLLRGTIPIVMGVGFAATLLICVALSVYMQYIAWVAIGIATLASIVACVYLWFHQYKDKQTDEQLIRTTEVAKDYMTAEDKKHVFGDGPEGGLIDKIQNAHTKQIVKNVKANNEDPKKKKFENSKNSKITNIKSMSPDNPSVAISKKR